MTDLLPALDAHDVHVWRADVGALAGLEPTLRSCLDAGERARADRFHFAADRTRHVVSHGVLRALLGHYAAEPAAELRFETGAMGKPRLAPPHGALEFNLSHSANVALVAVARGRAVGVDVEAWGTNIDAEELSHIAGSFFSPAERRALDAVAPERRRESFFACWSRKEAYLKATGVGVGDGLDHFDMTLAPGEPARLLADRRDPGAVARWTLCDLRLEAGYAGALAVDGRAASLARLVASPDLLRSLIDASRA